MVLTFETATQLFDQQKLMGPEKQNYNFKIYDLFIEKR